MGEYNFEWFEIEFENTNTNCRTTIYSESLADACAQFESSVGKIGEVADGCEIEITSIVFARPLEC